MADSRFIIILFLSNEENSMNLDSPIREVKGIGEKTEKLFQKAGVYTVRDILLYFPRGYLRYPAPTDPAAAAAGQKCAVQTVITKKPSYVPNSRVQLVTMDLSGAGHKLRLNWFRMPYVRNQIKPGQSYVFYGMVKEKQGMSVMDQPEIYTPRQYENLSRTPQPVYPLTAGLSANMVRKTIRTCLKESEPFPEYLPEEIVRSRNLYPLADAVREIHFPENEESCVRARNRLVFDELFLFVLSMRHGADMTARIPSTYIWKDDGFIKEVTSSLPYTLTGAQKKVLCEIQTDLASGYAMQRLIQGDVGSGKTVVAFLAMLLAARSGCQSALMAPTEVLAGQHVKKLRDLTEMSGYSFPIVLLTGSMSAAERREALKVMRTRPDAMIIGTHALIQEKPAYNNLGLVITDEQHRFGVHQRELFSAKGLTPHILVMSATPIPRTLAIILYGDLDISLIDEVPARRLPVKNCVVDPGYRRTAYNFIEKQIRAGRQAYIICPFVEESETLEGENVLDYSEAMSQRFSGICRVGCLHGRMKAEEKTSVMEAFLKNEIQILVSTTVVEVGVDVPNASVMMIENAERFGLAQLHQLRGRVGRGSYQSYCIFIDASGNQRQNERLAVLNRTNDGFEIAASDLKQRGPGDFFGIRQSGDFAFRLADIYQDAGLLTAAAEDAGQLLGKDPLLEWPAHQALKERIKAYQDKNGERLHL